MSATHPNDLAVTERTDGRIPSFPVLIGVVYAACVVLISLSVVAEMAFGYAGQGDQPRSLGEQLVGILVFGHLALGISIIGARSLRGSPRRASIGAIVFGILTIPALAFFWCGMPGMFGAAAAHLAGLTRPGRPADGAPRIFGIVGLVFAVANPLLHVVLISVSWLSELAS